MNILWCFICCIDLYKSDNFLVVLWMWCWCNDVLFVKNVNIGGSIKKNMYLLLVVCVLFWFIYMCSNIFRNNLDICWYEYLILVR